MQNNTRRISLVLGIFMLVVLVAGAILPIFQQNIAQTTERVEPTAAPTNTYPPPVTDFSGIALDQLYLHPTGLFTIAQPTGWTITAPSTQQGVAQVGMNNGSNLSVIDAYIQKPLTSVTTAQQVSDTLTQDVLSATWRQYRRWEETNRRIENERVVMDFSIDFNRQQYVARQVSWTDGEFIYSVRVVVPENGIELLRYLIDNLPATMTINRAVAGVPFDWQASYDPIANHIIRYPQGWVVQDNAPGRTTSLAGANGEALRIETRPLTTPLDEAFARNFVTSEQANASVTSVQPITRGTVSGFAVSYTFTTADGEPRSGMAQLLDAGNGTVHIANLRFPAPNVDLNALPGIDVAATPTTVPTLAPTATLDPAAPTTDPNVVPTLAPTPTLNPLTRYTEYVSLLNSFQLTAPINLNPLNLPPTPSPLPTLPPSSTPTPVTPTATFTATNTPVATNTPLPSSTPVPTNTTVPTNTPVPPTNTPRPTNTPLPTATSVPTNTPVPPTNTVRPTNTPRPTNTAVPATPSATPGA
jgi:hypothetical protein